MKKWMSALLAGALALSLATPALATGAPAGTYPVLTAGETKLVPLRAISESMGFTVGWDQAAGCATVSNDVYTVQVNPNNGTVQASYAEQAATVPMQVQDSRIYVDEAVFSS